MIFGNILESKRSARLKSQENQDLPVGRWAALIHAPVSPRWSQHRLAPKELGRMGTWAVDAVARLAPRARVGPELLRQPILLNITALLRGPGDTRSIRNYHRNPKVIHLSQATNRYSRAMECLMGERWVREGHCLSRAQG